MSNNTFADETNVIEELYKYSNNNDRDEDQILLAPIVHILQVPGKEIRGRLADAFNYWLQISYTNFKEIVDVIHLIHTTSLIIDDIQDDSVSRRGVPTSHIIYGRGQTINTCGYASHIIMNKIIAMGNSEAVKIAIRHGLNLCKGQGIEIYWRNNFTCPTEAEYILMVEKKTGELFNYMVNLMQLYSKCDKNFEPLLEILGLYFQIRDDYCNLWDPKYHANKGYCEDLAEGKYSFPIIHGIHSRPDDTRINDIVTQRPTDIETKRKCVSLLEEFGSLEYTRKTLENLDKKARNEIKRLGGNPGLEKILDEWKDIIASDVKEATGSP